MQAVAIVKEPVYYGGIAEMLQMRRRSCVRWLLHRQKMVLYQWIEALQLLL